MSNAMDTIDRARAERLGFLDEPDIKIIAANDATRLEPILVRCGGCRFTAPAQDVLHLIEIITKEGSDYVRDVSLSAK